VIALAVAAGIGVPPAVIHSIDRQAVGYFATADALGPSRG
jgi:hypothetical protein